MIDISVDNKISCCGSKTMEIPQLLSRQNVVLVDALQLQHPRTRCTVRYSAMDYKNSFLQFFRLLSIIRLFLSRIFRDQEAVYTPK